MIKRSNFITYNKVFALTMLELHRRISFKLKCRQLYHEKMTFSRKCHEPF